MKGITGVFIVVFISVAMADFIQGKVLTLVYAPSIFSVFSLEIANFLQYVIYSIIVTLGLLGILKLTKMLKNSKPWVKAS